MVLRSIRVKFAKFPRFRFSSLWSFDVQTKAVGERERCLKYHSRTATDRGLTQGYFVERRMTLSLVTRVRKLSKSRLRSVFPV